MAKAWPQVVLFGDSIFQFSTKVMDGFSFHSAVQTQCLRRFDVINRGLSGYNTAHALEMLPDVFPARLANGPKMEYLFILFGANDAAVNEQHVPLETYKENLAKIVTHPNIAAHGPRIFLVTPPPLNESQWEQSDLAKGRPSAMRHTKTSAVYSAAARDVGADLVARGLVTAVIDLYTGIMERALEKTPEFDGRATGADGRRLLLGDPESAVPGGGYLNHLMADGLHLASESYRIFYDLVKPHLGSEWAGTPEQDNVGFVLPSWRDLMKD